MKSKRGRGVASERRGADAPARRGYSSELRDQAKHETRARIVQAVIDVILKEGVHAFTVQNVAARAGVALRTVYRHFETREALLEGLSDRVEQSGAAFGIKAPTSLDEGLAIVRPLFRYFGLHQDAVRASVLASLATGYASKSHRERRAQMKPLLAAEYPNLAASELGDAASVLNLLTGTRGWYVMTTEQGLDSERAGFAAEWALQALCKDLKARNAAAKPR
jgi:AcrR family transcriptional regulator